MDDNIYIRLIKITNKELAIQRKAESKEKKPMNTEPTNNEYLAQVIKHHIGADVLV